MVSEVGISYGSCQSVSDSVWTCGWIVEVYVAHLLNKKIGILSLCVRICRNFSKTHSSLCVHFFPETQVGTVGGGNLMLPLWFKNSYCFHLLNSNNRTSACASDGGIMAGLTITREQLWTGQYEIEGRLFNHAEEMPYADWIKLELEMLSHLVEYMEFSNLRHPWTQLYCVNFHLKIDNS